MYCLVPFFVSGFREQVATKRIKRARMSRLKRRIACWVWVDEIKHTPIKNKQLEFLFCLPARNFFAFFLQTEFKLHPRMPWQNDEFHFQIDSHSNYLNSYPNPITCVSRVLGASVAVALPSSWGAMGECPARYS